MEQNFETSFIPKKPVVQQERKVKKPVGLLTVTSILVFVTMILVYGGLYFYRQNLQKAVAEKSEAIRLAENRFEPDQIRRLETLGRRLSASREILDKHIAVTPIFQGLSEITRKAVQYTDFSYTFKGEGSAGVSVRLNGLAEGYREIALQADLFDQYENFKEPIFSNLSLDQNGNVIFDLEFVVDPAFVDYKQMLQTQSDSFGIPIDVPNGSSQPAEVAEPILPGTDSEESPTLPVEEQVPVEN